MSKTSEPNQVQVGTRMITKVCTVAGCGRPHLAKGLCDMHYKRMRRTGSLDTGRAELPEVCSVPGCGRPDVIARGLCAMHYTRWNRHGQAGEPDARLGRSTVERIMQKVTISESHWIWSGALLNGLPVILDDGRKRTVRRVLAEDRGMVSGRQQVRQRCNEPMCVAPAHMYIPGATSEKVS